MADLITNFELGQGLPACRANFMIAHQLRLKTQYNLFNTT